MAAVALVLGGAAPAHAEEEAAAADADAETPTEMPNFSKMRVKELRAIVEDRGMQCKGCAEKADYVERAAEVYHLPIKAAPDPVEAKGAAGGEKPPMNDKDVDEMMRQMKDGPAPRWDCTSLIQLPPGFKLRRLS